MDEWQAYPGLKFIHLTATAIKDSKDIGIRRVLKSHYVDTTKAWKMKLFIGH